MTNNTKQQHTAGKWRVGNRLPEDNTLEVCGESLKESPLAYISPRPHYDDTQVANARLIAAAPEMLEVLRNLVDCSTENPGDFNPRFDPFLSNAHAILAKIEKGGE